MEFINQSITNMKLKLNAYTIISRLFPAVLTSVPILLLLYKMTLEGSYNNFLEYLKNFQLYGYVSGSFIYLYFYSQIIRYCSKIFENIYFHNRNGYPTTYLLLYENDRLSKKNKDKFREKAKKDFNFDLMTEEQEKNNLKESIRELNDITQQILAKNRKNEFVQKHNTWYGFSRNLLGGLPFCIAFSIINAILARIYFNDEEFFVLSIVIFVLSLILLSFNKFILVQNAEKFAEKLIAEYLTQ